MESVNWLGCGTKFGADAASKSAKEQKKRPPFREPDTGAVEVLSGVISIWNEANREAALSPRQITKGPCIGLDVRSPAMPRLRAAVATARISVIGTT